MSLPIRFLRWQLKWHADMLAMLVQHVDSPEYAAGLLREQRQALCREMDEIVEALELLQRPSSLKSTLGPISEPLKAIGWGGG